MEILLTSIASANLADHNDHLSLRAQIDKERAQSRTLSSRLSEVEEEVRAKQHIVTELGRERDRHIQGLAAFEQELAHYRQDAKQLNRDLHHWQLQR